MARKVITAGWCMLAVLCARADAATIFVDAAAAPEGDGTTWITAFQSIQQGIDTAVAGDEVWVRTGSYEERLTLKNNVAVLGGFVGTETGVVQRNISANPVTLEGESLEPPVVEANNVSSVLLDGFVINAAAGTAEAPGAVRVANSPQDVFVVNCVIEGGRGENPSAGAVGVNLGTLGLINCRFTDNGSTGSGGAVRAFLSNLTVRGCTFQENISAADGGAIHADSSTVTIENSNFEENAAVNGGAVFTVGGDTTIRSSGFLESSGGAVYIDSGVARVEESLFRLNTRSTRGGGLYAESGSALTLRNSMIVDNVAAEGGGIAVVDQPATIINCTISNNTASDGAGVLLDDATAAVSNTIFSGNDAIAVAEVGATANATFRHCLFFENVTGDLRDLEEGVIAPPASVNELPGSTANLAGDPSFANAGGGDYHITQASSARNNAEAALAPAEDFDLEARPGVDNLFDIGADEYTDAIPPQVLGLTRVGVNPTNGNTIVWEVVFSEPVSGVDRPDFSAVANGTLVDLSIATVVGSGANWNVAVSMGAGDGEITLQVVDDDSIVDLEGNPLGGTGTGNGDFSGNQTFVVDRTPPVVTLVGLNPVEIESGSFYIDPGATAVDSLDGDVSETLLPAGFVDIGTLGTYTVSYTARDRAGNVSEPAVRTVTVVDSAPAFILINGDNPMELEFGEPYIERGAVAFDQIDGDITEDLIITGPTSVTEIGSYQFTYTVTDSHGNTTSAIRVVNVVDTTAPTITIIGDNPTLVDPGEPYVDQGAAALDLVDGDVSSQITVAGTVNSAEPGTYEIIYTVTDSSGNTAEATREVIVQDRPDFVVLPSVQYISAFPRQVTFEVFNTRDVDQAWVAEVIEGEDYGVILSGATGTNTGVVTVGVRENRTNDRREVVIRISNADTKPSKAVLPIEVRVSQAPPAKAIGCGEGGGAGSDGGDLLVMLACLGIVAAAARAKASGIR